MQMEPISKITNEKKDKAIVLWPYLLTTKLRSVIRHNFGHSRAHL